MSNQAKTKKEYIDAWNEHVDELNPLAYELAMISNEEYKEFSDLKAKIKEKICMIAEKEFPEE